MYKFLKTHSVICAAVFVLITAPGLAADLPAYEDLADPEPDRQRAAAAIEQYRENGTDDALVAAVQAYIRTGRADAAWDIIEAHGPRPTKPYFKARLAAVNTQLAQAGTLSKLGWARTLKSTCMQRLEFNSADEAALECLAKFHDRAPGIAGGDKADGQAALEKLITANPARGYLVKAEIVFPDDPDQARGLVDKALSYERVYDEGLIQAAMVYGYFKDWAAVDLALGRVDKTSPIAGMQYYQFGKLSAEIGERLEDGEAALITFLQGDTLYYGVDFRGPAHWRLGQIFRWKEENGRAKGAFERALEHMPRLSPAKKDLKAIETLMREKR